MLKTLELPHCVFIPLPAREVLVDIHVWLNDSYSNQFLHETKLTLPSARCHEILSRCFWEMALIRKGHEITVTVTFHHFIFESNSKFVPDFKTFFQSIPVISHRMVQMRGHNNLGLTIKIESVHQCKWTFVPNLNKFPQMCLSYITFTWT